MIDYTVLPTVNATFNAISGIFLLVGYVLIRRRQINAHRNAMLGAFASSTLFSISYLIYHAQVGSRPFTGQRPDSLRVLRHSDLSRHSGGRDSADGHLYPVARAARQIRRAQAHRKMDVPHLVDVSVTGVIVYLMLYQM